MKFIKILLIACTALSSAFAFEWNPYTEFSAGGMVSEDFDGYTVSARVGTFFDQTSKHAVELEFRYTDLTDDATVARDVVFVVPSAFARTQSSKGELEEYMLLLNYRYKSHLFNWPQIPFYVGGGVGVNHYVFKDDSNLLIVPFLGFPTFNDRSFRNEGTTLVGQIFASIGYRLNECISLMLRSNVLVTKDFEIYALQRKVSSTSPLQVGLEGGILVEF